ncbi:leucine-rich repeat domain-containing protein [Histomonas meleagridis]|uniref:leucine-rich repeat domain-containing protein n=1 Tax=Histomonas meleagridis TaxID=135588 RepID=UPI0035595DE8|nr:leucine-rich repeat domain-containing protein [Histomonas meleagridis]KAH0796985.1 leucine-rich repeat domain-containing protein [Histomonas meleagridis]
MLIFVLFYSVLNASKPNGTELIIEYTLEDGDSVVDFRDVIYHDILRSNITKITILGNFTSISEGTFDCCESLKSIILPDTIENISENCFAGLPSLQSIRLSPNIKVIPNYTFANCPVLTSITLPANLEEIRHYAFLNCLLLTEIVIPAKVTSINSNSFYGCSNLARIDNQSPNFKIINSILYSDNALLLSPKVIKEPVVIDNNIRVIGFYSFASSNITSIRIPPNIRAIQSYAFSLSNLSSITFDEGNNLTIFSFAFSDTILTELHIPERATYIGEGFLVNCDYLANFTVDENNCNYSEVNGVIYNKNKNHLFRCPPAWSEKIFVIPSHVSTIAIFAFGSCKNIEKIDFGNSTITEIPNHCFAFCYSLSEMNIPFSVNTLKNCSFMNCTSLTYLRIHFNITAILGNPVVGCTNLGSIDVDENNTNFAYSSDSLAVYSKNMSIIYFGLPTSPYILLINETKVMPFAYYRYHALMLVFMRTDKIDYIGEYAFSSCPALTDIVFCGEEIEYLGENAFDKKEIRVRLNNFRLSFGDSNTTRMMDIPCQNAIISYDIATLQKLQTGENVLIVYFIVVAVGVISTIIYYCKWVRPNFV